MRRTIWTLLIITALSAAAVGLVPLGTAKAQLSTQWTAEYYNNTELWGSPVVVTQTNAAGFDWTASAPVSGLPVDYWSARYTGVFYLNAGPYGYTVQADDGVRVWINGQLVVDQWGVSTGQTYAGTFNANPGHNPVVVEFMELGGVAYLNFRISEVFAPPSPVPPTPIPPPTTATATVTAYYLNVRSLPGVNGAILTKIARNQTYPVLGRNAASSWWQLNVNGIVGWSSGKYLNVVNGQNVPVTDGTAVVYTATAWVNLNIRSGPGTQHPVVGWLPINQTVQIRGRNAAATWWQITYGPYNGWVSAYYTTPQPGLDVNQIPVTEEAPQPVNYTVTARVNVNIRSGPGTGYAVINWLPMFRAAQVVGRNQAATWWQIVYGATTGWVSAYYTTLQPGADVNLIPVTG
jgi:uncharacterized protein YraI